MIIGVNDFVRRQIAGSGKTYSPDLSFEDIARHAEMQMVKGDFQEGYREGVRIVKADRDFVKYFDCPFVKLDKSIPLQATMVCRRQGEEPYIQIRALKGTPLPAGRVEFIVYRHDILAENDEHSSEAEWELISIHAVPTGVDELPMNPVTMMRNQLGLKGGTKAKYSSDEWALSIQFWQEYASLSSSEGDSMSAT